MLTFIVVLAIVAGLLLIGIVMIQNPKGGGLSGAFGGFNNQVLGVQRTTDFLEKSTWTLAAIIGVFILGSLFFIPKGVKSNQSETTEAIKKQKNTAPAMPQQQQAPAGNN
jgi:preprotein translocase subunit SecG